MACVHHIVLLLVCCGLVPCCDGQCSVSCNTDYRSMLNCSISASEGPVSCDVEAECRTEADSLSGRCSIRPPHRWCTIQPEDFPIIIEMDANCTLRVKQLNPNPKLEEHSVSHVILYHIIKPRPPINLTLTQTSQAFNLSWDTVYTDNDISFLQDDLMYRVRLRPKDIEDEKYCLELIIPEDRRYQEIWCESLLPGRPYVAEVQASVNPKKIQNSGKEWSEWSSSTEWTCPSTDAEFIVSKHCFFVLLVVVPFVFFCFGKFRWHTKLNMFQYIPNPQIFFKPLYHTYQGDFKKWVGPVLTFTPMDILEKSVSLQVLSEKPLVTQPCQRELVLEPGGGGGGGSESGVGNWSLPSLVNHGSKRYFLGSNSLGTTRSGGHISMDTVTVSDWTGGSSRNGPQLEDHQSGLDVANQRAAGFVAEDEALLAERRGPRGRGFEEWQLQANDMENIEEISLDSYASNEQFDDGYPQVRLDLDTFDSGFLEADCSSPVTSECDGGEQVGVALLDGDVGAHSSNYVKQWVAITPTPEDKSSSGQQSV